MQPDLLRHESEKGMSKIYHLKTDNNLISYLLLNLVFRSFHAMRNMIMVT